MTKRVRLDSSLETEIMASDTSPVGVQELEHSHQHQHSMTKRVRLDSSLETEVMASDTSPIGVQESEHSHQVVATHEALKSLHDRSLTKTQNEDVIMTDQAGTQKLVCFPHIEISNN